MRKRHLKLFLECEFIGMGVVWCGSKIVSALEADVSAENGDNGVMICTIENTYLQPSSRPGKYKVPLYWYWTKLMLMENSIFTCNPFFL